MHAAWLEEGAMPDQEDDQDQDTLTSGRSQDADDAAYENDRAGLVAGRGGADTTTREDAEIQDLQEIDDASEDGLDEDPDEPRDQPVAAEDDFEDEPRDQPVGRGLDDDEDSPDPVD
jgi:hypothetical protein